MLQLNNWWFNWWFLRPWFFKILLNGWIEWLLFSSYDIFFFKCSLSITASWSKGLVWCWACCTVSLIDEIHPFILGRWQLVILGIHFLDLRSLWSLWCFSSIRDCVGRSESILWCTLSCFFISEVKWVVILSRAPGFPRWYSTNQLIGIVESILINRDITRLSLILLCLWASPYFSKIMPAIVPFDTSCWTSWWWRYDS